MKPKPEPTFTDLQRKTQIKYEACLRDGGHQPSGKEIVRNHAGAARWVQVCKNCSVPY